MRSITFQNLRNELIFPLKTVFHRDIFTSKFKKNIRGWGWGIHRIHFKKAEVWKVGSKRLDPQVKVKSWWRWRTVTMCCLWVFAVVQRLVSLVILSHSSFKIPFSVQRGVMSQQERGRGFICRCTLQPRDWLLWVEMFICDWCVLWCRCSGTGHVVHDQTCSWRMRYDACRAENGAVVWSSPTMLWGDNTVHLMTVSL